MPIERGVLDSYAFNTLNISVKLKYFMRLFLNLLKKAWNEKDESWVQILSLSSAQVAWKSLYLSGWDVWKWNLGFYSPE